MRLRVAPASSGVPADTLRRLSDPSVGSTYCCGTVPLGPAALMPGPGQHRFQAAGETFGWVARRGGSCLADGLPKLLPAWNRGELASLALAVWA